VHQPNVAEVDPMSADAEGRQRPSSVHDTQADLGTHAQPVPELDPDAAAVLLKVREAGVPEWHTLGAVRAREVYRQRADLLATQPSPVAHVGDVTIDGPGGPLRVKIIDPGGDRPLPVLVYLHGGGWTLGDVDTFEEVCRRFAVAAQCLVVAPDYRLAPEHPFPAALDDSLATIQWVWDHAETIGADPARVAVGGDSAGGNLSAAVCLKLRDEGGPRLSLQLLIYPALRARFDTDSYRRNASGYLLSRDDCR